MFSILKYLFKKEKKCYDLNRIERSMGMENGMKLGVLDIAHFFSAKETMTTKKLQKLVYYAYAWYIALNNDDKDNIKNKLCDDAVFEAWVHGPVCKKVYSCIPSYYGTVDRYEGDISPLITGELEKFLNKIYKTFGKFTGDELEVMTHQEMPWQNARDTLSPSQPSSKKILESDMFVYYNEL